MARYSHIGYKRVKRDIASSAMARIGTLSQNGYMPSKPAKSANRISEIRKEKGLSQEELGNLAEAHWVTISKLENGRMKLTQDWMNRLAKVLDVKPGDLLEGEFHPPIVPVVGYVGAGAAMYLYSEGQGPFDEVPAPEGSTETTVAVEIKGDSLGSFFDQWLVFYDDVHSPITPNMVGKLCVVHLLDGRTMIKKVKRGTIPGHYTLLSQFEPPIYDVEIAWAALVKNMVPR